MRTILKPDEELCYCFCDAILAYNPEDILSETSEDIFGNKKEMNYFICGECGDKMILNKVQFTIETNNFLFKESLTLK